MPIRVLRVLRGLVPLPLAQKTVDFVPPRCGQSGVLDVEELVGSKERSSAARESVSRWAERTSAALERASAAWEPAVAANEPVPGSVERLACSWEWISRSVERDSGRPRWVSTRGETGPWSAAVSATVPG